MAYNHELVKQLLGEEVAKLFDGTIEVEPSKGEKLGDLILGDKITFNLLYPVKEPRQFKVEWK